MNFTRTTLTLSAVAILFFAGIANAQKVNLSTDVSGTLPPQNGGSGVANNSASTSTVTGNFAKTETRTGVTAITYPTSGTLISDATAPTFGTMTLGGLVWNSNVTPPGQFSISAAITGPICGAGTGAPAACGSPQLTVPAGVGTARQAQVIAEGATAHNWGNLANGACETITTAATGTATTDVIEWAFNADISGTTGFGGAGTMVTIYRWPTSGNVNFRACNYTGGADINPSSVTINWKVIR